MLGGFPKCLEMDAQIHIHMWFGFPWEKNPLLHKDFIFNAQEYREIRVFGQKFWLFG